MHRSNHLQVDDPMALSTFLLASLRKTVSTDTHSVFHPPCPPALVATLLLPVY